jgi:hypothetical protein
MLITKTALFIGYSLSDLDFKHIREIVLSRLGRFQRTSYIVQFNMSAPDVEKMQENDVHVINLEVPRESSIDEILAGFFYEIREELDAKGEG